MVHMSWKDTRRKKCRQRIGPMVTAVSRMKRKVCLSPWTMVMCGPCCCQGPEVGLCWYLWFLLLYPTDCLLKLNSGSLAILPLVSHWSGWPLLSLGVKVSSCGLVGVQGPCCHQNHPDLSDWSYHLPQGCQSGQAATWGQVWVRGPAAPMVC